MSETTEGLRERLNDLLADMPPRQCFEARRIVSTLLSHREPGHDPQRWNIEETDEGLRVCRGDHERSEDCEWEEYAPAHPEGREAPDAVVYADDAEAVRKGKLPRSILYTPGSGGYQQWLHDTNDGRRRYTPVYFGATPPREPDREPAALLFNWLNSETQMIRDSYCNPTERDDPARVDAAWNHYDPDGFALAVATRSYLERVGYAPAGPAHCYITQQGSRFWCTTHDRAYDECDERLGSPPATPQG